jgi:hypothetical protein
MAQRGAGALQRKFWRKLDKIADDLVGKISEADEEVELLVDLAEDSKCWLIAVSHDFVNDFWWNVRPRNLAQRGCRHLVVELSGLHLSALECIYEFLQMGCA